MPQPVIGAVGNVVTEDKPLIDVKVLAVVGTWASRMTFPDKKCKF